jgi:hypothetical protein
MADWATISSLATAGGTLVLAVATFSSVRSANRSARLAERSLMVGLRPVLVPSRENDPRERVRFGDGVLLTVHGHGGAVLLDEDEENIYMAIALRNGGSGLAVLHAWHAEPRETSLDEAPDVEGFQRQQLDLYIPAGDTGYWQGRISDPSSPNFKRVRQALIDHVPLMVDLVYGDHEGGQRDHALSARSLARRRRPPRRRQARIGAQVLVSGPGGSALAESSGLVGPSGSLSAGTAPGTAPSACLRRQSDLTSSILAPTRSLSLWSRSVSCASSAASCP